LPLNDLTGFRQPPPNWILAEKVTASYADSQFTAVTGTGVLLNQFNKSIQFKKEANLFTRLEHGDLYLELDFNMPRGSNSGIYFQSRYEIQLADSWGIETPRFSDCGGIYERWDEKRTGPNKGFEGHPPLRNATFAPGLWQHLEILFKAPRFDNSGKKISHARFVFVKLNGITIHEDLIVSGPTRAASFEDEIAQAPLMFQGDHGMVAFRNIRYAPQEELDARWKSLGYAYYEGKFNDYNGVPQSKPTRSGKAIVLDSRLADQKDDYVLAFDGILNLPVTDTYYFTMQLSGQGYLEIDGKTVIPSTWTWIGGEVLSDSVSLSAGDHRVKLWNNKQVNWADPGLALYIQKPNSRKAALHGPASMPERPPAPLIQVEPGKEPEMVRSFYMQGTKKLTHVVSTGSPNGVHYAYNLLQGGLLEVWKGDFLNTTDMWYERGEPQTASPLGAPILLRGKCPILEDEDIIPDSTADYQYKGYRLNENRYPVFEYSFKGMRITDQISPANKGIGLVRNIRIDNNKNARGAVLLARGTTLIDLGNGMYAVNNQQYYIRVPQASKNNLLIKQTTTGKALIMKPGNSEITYELVW
jgi:hypothetical protein